MFRKADIYQIIPLPCWRHERASNRRPTYRPQIAMDGRTKGTLIGIFRLHFDNDPHDVMCLFSLSTVCVEICWTSTAFYRPLVWIFGTLKDEVGCYRSPVCDTGGIQGSNCSMYPARYASPATQGSIVRLRWVRKTMKWSPRILLLRYPVYGVVVSINSSAPLRNAT